MNTKRKTDYSKLRSSKFDAIKRRHGSIRSIQRGIMARRWTGVFGVK